MLRAEHGWIYSPSDLVDLLDCELRSMLTQAHRAAVGNAPAPTNSADRLASTHGQAHEAAVLARLRDLHADGVVEIDQPAPTPAALHAAAEQTREALAAGVPVVYQGVMFDGAFYGRPDFLVRADLDLLTGKPKDGYAPSDLTGTVVYEPYDSKLARHAAPSAVLQLTAYAAALPTLGLPVPTHMHLLLGNGTQTSLAVADFTALLEDIRTRLLTRLQTPASLPDQTWGQAQPACAACRFADHCATGRESGRDLSLVADIRADQRRKLTAAGLPTIDDLAAASSSDRPPTMSTKTFESLRAQAALQARQDQTRTPADPTGAVLYEIVDPDVLAALPTPSPGDVYFDMEGDPYALGNTGLEYLFGAVTLDAPTSGTTDRDAPAPVERFQPWWAHSRAQEKAAFEAFVDFVIDRIEQHPDAHVYHYASYEKTALTRLASQHATREVEVDRLLRAGVLVDLYAVVRKAIRVSQRSYSIKYLEALYMPTGRTGEVTNAASSIEAYEDYLDAVTSADSATAEQVLAGIGEYNEYDCVSTHRLHRWILGIRDEAGIAQAPVAALDEEDDAAKERTARQIMQEQLSAELVEGVHGDSDVLSGDERARTLLAGSVGYYRRELNPSWWEFYAAAEMPLHDLEVAPSCTVPLRVDAGAWEPPTGRARTWSRDLDMVTDPTTPHPFTIGDTVRLLYRTSTSATTTNGKVTHSTARKLSVTERAPEPGLDLAPVAVLPGPPVPSKPKDASVEELGAQTVAALATSPLMPDSPAMDLLARRRPHLNGRAHLPVPADHGGDMVTTVIAAVDLLDGSYLAVQGPPGAGKTYLAAQLIKHLTTKGRSVGVCSTSHKAVENVLAAAIRSAGPDLPVAKRPTSKGPDPTVVWEQPRDNRKLAQWRVNVGPAHVVGGTSWNFAAPEMAADPVDVLIIDEAGQFSLTDVLAVSRAARNIVLLGDPQQLPQVVQGTHPTGVAASALGHLLGDAEIIPDELGYFLDQTRRMHPAVCAPVSALAYQGRLHAHTSTSQRSIAGVTAGLAAIPVDHEGNSTSSPQEAQRVVELAIDLVGRAFTDGPHTRPLGQDDVLVVAPFNSQVRLIRHLLEESGLGDIRVGTVDRFQGQEAPAVIMSMTTSSADELTRGLDFLLSRNRLNVALSRAQVVAYLLSSPQLRRAPARTVDQLRLISGLVSVTS